MHVNIITVWKCFYCCSYTTAKFPDALTLTQEQPNSRHAATQKQRQKARVTGSSSRMIEVCACLSSELFQAAALSEHAPDDVSQGVDRAVITGSLQGHSIRQTALRGVRHTHRTCLHVSGPGCSHGVQPCWQTDISQRPLSFTLSLSLRLFAPLLLTFSPTSQSAPGGRDHHWQVYLNIYAEREKTRMLSPTRHASISTHAPTQPLTWNICFPKPLHVLLQLVKKGMCASKKIESPDKMASHLVCSCFHRATRISI